MSEDNIKKIFEAYRDDLHHDGCARTVDLSEIKENDFNLNVSLYVFPEEEREHIDIKNEWDELINLGKEIKSIEDKLDTHLKTIFN